MIVGHFVSNVDNLLIIFQKSVDRKHNMWYDDLVNGNKNVPIFISLSVEGDTF